MAWNMADENDQPPVSKLTRSKERWAREGIWKSAKWLQSVEILEHDAPGYWEVRGYHNRGDPWLEQRYSGD